LSGTLFRLKAFHVTECVKVRAPLETNWRPPWWGASPG